MRIMRRVISFCFVILLLGTLLPAVSRAAEVIDEGTFGENLSWTLDDSGMLTISGIGEMPDYTQSAAPPWEGYRSQIKKAVIGQGITGIGSNVFSNYTALTAIDFSDSVTRIGEGAFFYCSKLTMVTLPENLASIEAYAFSYTPLKSITIPASVTSVGSRAFNYCNSLAQLTVAQENSAYCAVDNVLYDKALTEAIYCAQGYSGSVTVPEGVTRIGAEAFRLCHYLKKVTLPSTVTDIEPGAFSSSAGPTWIAVDSENPSFAVVSNILYNKDMTTVVLCPGDRASSVTLPDGVTEIGPYAFNFCTNLCKIELPDSLLRIGENAFSICSKLTDIVLPEGLVSIGDYAFEVCNKLNAIHIPGTVTYIGDYAFASCNIQSLTIPASVSYIGSHAFRYCVNLREITFLGDAPVFSETAFRGLTTTAKYPKFNRTWTEEVRQNYEGTITWQPWDNCEHVTKIENAKAATCTEDGYTGDAVCTLCGYTITEGTVISALGHTAVTDPAVPPTCGEPGLSEGQHCGVCGQVLAAQSTVDALGHSYIYTVGTAPTTEEEGWLLAGCSVCSHETTVVLPVLSEVDYTLVDGQFVWNNTDYGIFAFAIPGDINGDGSVNNKDLTRLFQYLSGYEVEVEETRIDINGDGSVNNKDLTRLFQYLSGYEVVIY